MKIANKISLSFFAVAIVLTVSASSIFYYAAKSNLEQEIESKLEAVLLSRADHIETYLNMLKISVGQLSKSAILENLLKMTGTKGPGWDEAFAQAMKRLSRTKEANPSIYEFVLLDTTGKVVAASDKASIGLDKSTDAYFLGGQKGLYIKDVYYSTTTRTPLITVSAPFLDSRTGELLGVLAARVKADGLYDIVREKTGLGKTGEIYIVNKYGFMITPSRFIQDAILKQRVDTQNLAYARLHKDRVHVLPRKNRVDVFPDYRGIPVLGAHTYIPGMQWAVLGEVDATEAFAPLTTIRIIFLVVLILVPVLAWLLGIIISGAITGPLHRLHKGMEVVGEGNLDYKVGTAAKDEVGQLSRAFDAMTKDLKKTTASIDVLNKEIVERKKVQEELKEATEIKSKFTSMVSHELRSPLAVVKESVSLILEGLVGAVNDEQKALLDTAKNNTDRLGRLINDVLDLQKIESGKMEYDIRENDINEVVASVSRAMGLLAKEKNLDLAVEAGGDVPRAMFDRDKIIQVITNLLSNAITYTEKGNITVSTKREGDMVHVMVRDTGAGIRAEDMHRLFLAFEQLDSGRSRKKGGTGLGLAISKEIVLAHKGKIWAESVAGKGSVFHFTLPIAGGGA